MECEVYIFVILLSLNLKICGILMFVFEYNLFFWIFVMYFVWCLVIDFNLEYFLGINNGFKKLWFVVIVELYLCIILMLIIVSDKVLNLFVWCLLKVMVILWKCMRYKWN